MLNLSPCSRRMHVALAVIGAVGIVVCILAALRYRAVHEELRGESPGFVRSGETDPQKLVIRRTGAVRKKIRNVVLFVLGSVPAQYLDIYGGAYSVNRGLRDYLGHSLRFDALYAHSPSTDSSAFSLLCSAYPRIAPPARAHADPAMALPSLSSELSRRGYRTAFFNAGENGSEELGAFLSFRGFDRIRYSHSRSCGSAAGEDSDGTDDACAAKDFLDWTEESPEPFFGVLWTNQTRYPYSPGLARAGVKQSSAELSYLEALRHADFVLGQLLRKLETRGLLDSTLVVVTADHGEAFGQHGHFGHASRLYDENIRVPLLFIKKGLFFGEHDAQAGGMIDIAPTIMDLLGLPQPLQWQGASLLRSCRSPRVYFFAPWSAHRFGFRENSLKLLYNADEKRYELYDLAKDPGETVNLAVKFPLYVREGEEKIAEWVFLQQQYYSRVKTAN